MNQSFIFATRVAVLSRKGRKGFLSLDQMHLAFSTSTYSLAFVFWKLISNIRLKSETETFHLKIFSNCLSCPNLNTHSPILRKTAN